MRSSPYYCRESIRKVTEALWLEKPIVVGVVEGIKHLKEFSWNYSEEQLKKVFEAI